MPPVTGVLDNFNRANGALGSNWIDLASGTGYSRPLIASNKMILQQYYGGLWATSFGQDQEVFATLDDAIATNMAILFRIASPNTGGESGYIMYINNTVDGPADLQKITAGVHTNVSLGWFNYINAAGDKYFWATAIGDTFKLYSSPNGSTGWTLLKTWTDSTYIRSGYIGVYNENGGTGPFPSIDNFGGGTISAVTVDSCTPDADITTTGWTTTPLFSKVNDASDATVIQATAS